MQNQGKGDYKYQGPAGPSRSNCSTYPLRTDIASAEVLICSHIWSSVTAPSSNINEPGACLSLPRPCEADLSLLLD
eukprot:280255-Pleurochrysis_carterae.AAC.5